MLGSHVNLKGNEHKINTYSTMGRNKKVVVVFST